MPLYEYLCDTCGEQFDKMVRFSEASQTPECPYCHSSDTHKLISMFAATGDGFRFEASGKSGCSSDRRGRFS